MLTIGLIKEGKTPADNRVALTPAQCRWLQKNTPIKVLVQSCNTRCFKDIEYVQAGVKVLQNVDEADILLGIKEVPVQMLVPNKTYLFFSHTKKLQPHNQKLFKALQQNNITLIDYECLEHADGQRMIGFGFFAGIVGAHNGMMCFGNKTKQFSLDRVHRIKDYRQLIHTYFGLKLPPIKIAVTGSGRVAHGIIEIMNLMDVQEVEPDEYKEATFTYPVYVHLKGGDLYKHKETGKYNRTDFHANPNHYECVFNEYLSFTDVLLNGVYWDKEIPRLFNKEDIASPHFKIQTIADITDDENGSVPINMGDGTIENPVYGIDKQTGNKTNPYLQSSIDIMAVGNLPNELPRDASRFFGEQLIKYVLDDILKGGSEVIERATILNKGKLTTHFEYMKNY